MAITQVKIGEQLHDIKDYRSNEQLQKELSIPRVNDYTVTLGTTWNGSSAPFFQDVVLASIVNTDTPIIDVVVDSSNYKLIEPEWNNIFKVESLAGKLRFYAKAKTTISLQIKVKVVK